MDTADNDYKTHTIEIEHCGSYSLVGGISKYEMLNSLNFNGKDGLNTIILLVNFLPKVDIIEEINTMKAAYPLLRIKVFILNSNN